MIGRTHFSQHYGFKAIVVEPGTHKEPMYADDRRLYPIYAKCEELGVPVFILAGGNAGPDMSYEECIDKVLYRNAEKLLKLV